jgi:hypothetical protein
MGVERYAVFECAGKLIRHNGYISQISEYIAKRQANKLHIILFNKFQSLFHRIYHLQSPPSFLTADSTYLQPLLAIPIGHFEFLVNIQIIQLS